MRVAFFSPLPPVQSGISDYSAALLSDLSRLAEITTFTFKPRAFDAAAYDAMVCQLGNNPHHIFAYEVALEHPSVVVMHEANLHHLIADMTIARGDWDTYLAEVRYGAGEEAFEYAHSYVRTVERAPDYQLPLLRRVLERSRAAIVHSTAVEEELRALGFRRPIARIPHGAWIVDGDRMAYRHKLGLSERTPLIGVFGFLKPYKRIAESLRAFRRLVRLVPDAKMILVGEPHPELKLAEMIRSMGLAPHVRALGFTPIEDFNGYLSACDVVLNLRYPTVGESSGTLLRAFGMGKAVVVSDVGSFREYPDEICLKAPVDSSEEDYLFEYLNLLVSRPDIAQSLGKRARAWVARECNWASVAKRYADFLGCVIGGREWKHAEPPASHPGEPAEPVAAPPQVPANYIEQWTPPDDGARSYVETHLTRLEKTLSITPRGTREGRVLEMGAYFQITPSLKTKLGYGEVRGCYFGMSGTVEHRKVVSVEGEEFECAVELFNAEKDRFPYPDAYFSAVLCCELIEHLASDPMYMMIEIHRVLKDGGALVLTTPNIASLRAISAVLHGHHPGFFTTYLRPGDDRNKETRHNREYTPYEIRRLLENSGFEVTLLETGPFRDAPKPEQGWVNHLLHRYILNEENRGDGIYAVGRKIGSVRERYPSWLYS